MSEGGIQNVADVLASQGIPTAGVRADGKEVTMPPGVDASTLEALKAQGFELTSPTAAQAEAPAAEPEAETPVETDGLSIPDKEVSEVVTLESIQDYAFEFAEKGELSDDSRAAVKAAHNIDDTLLDLVLAGITATSTQNDASLLQQVGASMEDFNAAAKWSQANETQEQINERNQMLKSTEPGVRKLALESIIRASQGEPNHSRSGVAIPPASSQTFQQVLKGAMANPLYSKQNSEGDAFRAQVYKQLETAKR